MTKGPAFFLAQSACGTAPFNSFERMCGVAAARGGKRAQIPARNGCVIDLVKTSDAQDHGDDGTGIAATPCA